MNISDYSFYKDAYNGSGGFLDGSYIDKFPRESDEKYTERQKIAYYTNMFTSKVNRYNGYLFKTAPVRMSSNSLMRQIFDDVDNKGNSANVFMSNFAKNSKALGSNLILIDMPKNIPTTLKEQIDARAVPYFVEIAIDSVDKYKIDKFGNFDYISFKDTIDNSTFEEDDVIDVIRYYDKTTWKVIADDKVIEQGEHNLGVCPVVSFGENGVFPDSGEFSQIAHLQKRHYNLKSELDEILRGQTFSLLTINADVPSDVEIKLSTDNAIAYGKDMKAPSFVSPDSSSAAIYQKEIESVENAISKIAYDLTTNNSQESGIALDIKFQGLNGSLSNFAMRMQDLESNAFDIVCKYLGITNDVTVEYPKVFSIVDVEKEISILGEVKALGYTLPKYEQLKLQQIVANDLNSVNIEDVDVINGEIEDALKGE